MKRRSGIEYRKIEAAYEFVSSGPLFSNSALIDLATGAVLLQSESGGIDEFPKAVDDDRYLPIPTRSELHLGKTLVLSFVEAHAPGALAEVLDMFGRKGAYPRFKAFLDAHLLLDRWYDYEGAATERALRKWCEEKGIALKG